MDWLEIFDSYQSLAKLNWTYNDKYRPKSQLNKYFIKTKLQLIVKGTFSDLNML